MSKLYSPFLSWHSFISSELPSSNIPQPPNHRKAYRDPHNIFQSKKKKKNLDNCAKFKSRLSKVNWNLMLIHNDTNINCNFFLDTVFSIYYSSFSNVTKHIFLKRLQNPWITQGIIKSLHH